ncbi:hypothetical protein fugu_009515 [Takifugu bimaculatus]|uniref:Uncharacterized protein n=1 Tax=Takifugu bimaculatus TaxID=433685 RepID=A0A4Z2CCQ1_9TELE|nr:hypothetical protein fugu_009515 [Takifugu bimaculatus]
MRAVTLGGFLVLPWSSNGGADMEHRLEEGTHRLLKCGALLGVTVFYVDQDFGKVRKQHHTKFPLKKGPVMESLTLHADSS